jgi:hypothetical protein
MTMQNFTSYNRKFSRVLDESELFKIAPSIFAQEAHDSRSDRYTYIPTIDVVRAMVREGFQPVDARQSRTRDVSKREFTKHLIRFRQPDSQMFAVGDTSAEIVLLNSHDGSSSYQIMSGLFRLACLNGLVVADSTIDNVRVHHKGDIVSKVIEGSFTVLGQAQKALAAPADWSAINTSQEERQALADAARVLRFGDSEGNVDTPIEARQLLIPRRVDDKKSDLWTTFNVIQENVIRGGLSARGPRTVDNRGRTVRGRMVSTRQVNGIDQDVRLNKALWTLGEAFAKFKA